MSGNKTMTVVKKIVGTLILPVAMFIIVMIACYTHGKTYFATLPMWKAYLPSLAISVSCAMGIGLQFKCGRFDFSGGAVMLLSAILAGNITMKTGTESPVVLAVLCVFFCVVLSLLVGVVYVYGRLPIAIATIGMALLYESITCLIFGGSGINIVSNMKLRVFSSYPMMLIPMVIAIAIYAFYSHATVLGKEAVLLANNQQSAVNIGIDEKKSVLMSYLYSGLIFGFATMIYSANGMHGASFSSLTTVGELFSNILPVFIALMLGAFCSDTIGIIMGSFTLTMMSYGLTTVINSDMGSAISMIISGVFILAINIISGQSANIVRLFKKRAV